MTQQALVAATMRSLRALFGEPTSPVAFQRIGETVAAFAERNPGFPLEWVEAAEGGAL